MNNNRQRPKPNSYGIFEAYADAANAKVLQGVLLVAVLFELLHMYLGNYLQGASFNFNGLGYESNNLALWVTVIYIVFFIIIYYYYESFPDLISILFLGFVLVHQIHSFFLENSLWIGLVFWIVITLVVASQYIGPGISLPVIGASYVWFFAGLYFYDIDIADHVPFIWIMLLTVVLGIIFSLEKNKREKNYYLYEASIKEDYADYSKKLNFDELTGLPTQFALVHFIENYKASDGNKPVFVIVMDLDDMKVCNTVYGRDAGDAYLKTFGKIIRFLVKGSGDIIARTGGDVFVGILTSYEEASTFERRLERYNHLLKDEFDKGHDDGKFLPHYSYGYVQAKDLSNFSKTLNEAERRMYEIKEVNKKHLIHNSYFMPEINYLSLFSDSNITVIVWLIKDDWPVGFVTENIKDLLGYSQEYFLEGAGNFMGLIHPEDADQVNAEVENNIKNKTPHFEQIYRLRKANGQYVWVRDYSVPVWKEGKLVQINGYMYNINFEVEAEAILREKEKRFSNVIEATNMGVWEWNIQTDEMTVNNRYAEMLGYSREELMPLSQKKRAEVTHPDDLTRFYEVLNLHFEGNQPNYQMELRVKHKDGHMIWILDRGKVMKWTSDGQPEVMVGAQTDITDIKRTEARLRQSEKLNAIGRMAGGIAHDMNNLLMMMSGFIGIAKEKDDLVAFRETNESIETLIGRASDTVNQIMGFTKHRMYDPRIIDLKVLLNDLVRMIDRTFEKNIRIILDMTDAKALIKGDQSLIENALLNLCLNAKDAMTKGGELRLKLFRTTIEEPIHTFTGDLSKGEYVCIEVSDEGMGIEETYLERIFDPFFTTKETGGGIGLSMVINVVKEHGGDLNVSSEKDVGTNFTLYFPYEVALDLITMKHEIPKVLKTVQSGTSIKVMIVDDEPVLALVLHEFLEEKGCTAVYFTSPLEALSYYKAEMDNVDLVVMDMLMPEMSGTELFDEMLTINNAVKVIYLSGYSEGIEIRDEIRKNVLGFLKKPLKLDELYDFIIQIEKF